MYCIILDFKQQDNSVVLLTDTILSSNTSFHISGTLLQWQDLMMAFKLTTLLQWQHDFYTSIASNQYLNVYDSAIEQLRPQLRRLYYVLHRGWRLAPIMKNVKGVMQIEYIQFLSFQTYPLLNGSLGALSEPSSWSLLCKHLQLLSEF